MSFSSSFGSPRPHKGTGVEHSIRGPLTQRSRRAAPFMALFGEQARVSDPESGRRGGMIKHRPGNRAQNTNPS